MHEVSESEVCFKFLSIEFNCMVSTMMIPLFMSDCRVFNLGDVSSLRRGSGCVTYATRRLFAYTGTRHQAAVMDGQAG